MPTTIVVGAGWAGLSCAYELTKAGHKVIVIEAAPQIGGRARSVKFQNSVIDNGQHIGLGAYHTMRQLIKELQLDPQQLFMILPLEIRLYGPRPLHLKLPKLPAPFNLIAGILTASSITSKAKLQVLRLASKLHSNNFALAKDCSILELLQNYHQSSDVIEQVWEPIALAAMSTAIKQASAQIFCNVLQQAFATTSKNCHWYLPATDLSNVLPQHLVNNLHQSGQQIICNQSIKHIYFNDQTVQVFSNSQSWQGDHLVLATPPWQTLKLLEQHPALATCCDSLQQFRYEPITTLFFQYPEPIRLPYPMLGILNATCQWIFDRSFAAQPDILSAVITGPTAQQFINHQELKAQVLLDISKHFPHLAQPIASKIICEKSAAFTCDVATQKIRPYARTAIKNLWLCGDYVQTGLPASLEGALLSGRQTAEEVLRGC